MKSRNLIVIICLLMTLSCWTVVWGDDTTPPNAPTVTGIADDRGSSNTDAITNDPTLTISGTAEANSTVEVFRDGGSIGTTPVNGSGDWTFDYTGTSLDDGLYSFTATATDAAGNTSAASSAFNVLIDAKKPPAPDGRDPANNTYTNENTPTFSWSEPTDLPDPGGSGVRDYHIIVYDSTHTQVKDSYPSNTQYTPSSGSPLDDDAYMWKLATRDVAGNTGAWGAEWTLVVDTEDPIVTVTLPNGGEYWAGGSTKTITWTASDTNFGANPIDLHYTTNGTDWTEIAIGEANDGSYSWSPVPNLDLSTVKVRVTATDLAGNSASDQSDADFTIDSTRPETTGLDLPDTESVDANCSITIPYSATVTDNCCINAGDVSVVVEFVSGAGTAILSAPPATIVNNGVDQVDVSGSFTVSDLTAGDVVIRVRINGADCTGNAAIEASDTVTIGDSTIPTISLDLPDGDLPVDENTCEYTVNYTATVTDNCCIDAGNVSVVVEFVPGFDTATLVAPTATIVNDGGSPNTQVNISGSFTVSALTNDPVRVRVCINGTDCNGNAATQASDVVTIVDSTIPVIVWNTELPPSPQYVDSMICTIALPIQATVTDNCCILAGNVSVDISVTNATLAHGVTVTQLGDAVLVAGIITVSNLTGCPAVLSVAIGATDCCGNDAAQLTDSVEIYDNTNPVIVWDTELPAGPGVVSSDTCTITLPIQATVTDNCCILAGNVSVDISVTNATLAHDVTVVQVGADVLVSGNITVSALTGCPAVLSVEIDVTDCCGNAAIQLTDTVNIIDNTIPVINDLTVSDEMVDANCEATVTFSATVTDNCCVTPGAVTVDVTLPIGNAPLGVPVINKVQNGQSQVDVSGSVLVSDLTGCPATVQVTIHAVDCCTNVAVQETSTGDVTDTSIPVISGLTVSDETVDANCEATVTFSATVTDNCCVTPGAVTVDVTLPIGNATLGVPVINKVQNRQGQVDVTGSVLVSALSGCPATVRVTIDATGCCGNDATQASDTGYVNDLTNPVIVWDTELPVGPEVVSSDTCTITLPIQATVTDNCCILAGNVSVDISVTNATLAHDVTITQVGNAVLVAGIITVSNLSGCPAVLSVAIDATDCCGNAAIQLTDTVNIIDTTIPVISGFTVSDEAVDANCEATVTFSATVTDNCCVTPGAVTVDVTLLTGNATLGVPVINKVQNGQGQVDVSGSVLVSALSGCSATVQVTIDATDCCGNDATQVSDTGYVTDTSIPVINDLVVDDHVLVSADCCETTVNFTANVTDNCCIVPDNVAVTVTLPTNNAILENIVVNRVQNGQGRVDITGSADVRCLTSCPARVEVHIEATDCCGNDAVPVSSTATEGRVYDETIPDPKDDRFRWIARGGDAPFQLDVMQNDTDNCSSCTCCGTMWIHDIVDPPEYGTATIEVDHGDCNGGSSIRYAQYHGYCGTDEFTYRIEDSCGNVSSTATVFVNLIAETVMDDIYLTTCTNNLISFAIEATDPRINPRNPDEIPFVFSIVTPPMHGVISGDLGDMTYTVHGGTTEEIESAAITLLYTPAAGFTGRDALTLRFSDPFGGSSTAMVDIAVIECAGQPGAPPPFALRQGEIFPLIVPLTFASVYEKEWNTVTLIAETDGTVYQGALSATWEESIGRYVLGLDTASLPPGLYRMTIPLGNGETVTLMIEVSEAI